MRPQSYRSSGVKFMTKVLDSYRGSDKECLWIVLFLLAQWQQCCNHWLLSAGISSPGWAWYYIIALNIGSCWHQSTLCFTLVSPNNCVAVLKIILSLLAAEYVVWQVYRGKSSKLDGFDWWFLHFFGSLPILNRGLCKYLNRDHSVWRSDVI